MPRTIYFGWICRSTNNKIKNVLNNGLHYYTIIGEGGPTKQGVALIQEESVLNEVVVSMELLIHVIDAICTSVHAKTKTKSVYKSHDFSCVTQCYLSANGAAPTGFFVDANVRHNSFVCTKQAHLVRQFVRPFVRRFFEQQ